MDTSSSKVQQTEERLNKHKGYSIQHEGDQEENGEAVVAALCHSSET